MPERSYTEFQSGLKGRKPVPVYLFHGEEDFFIEEGVASLIAGTVDPATKSFNLDVLYGSRTDAKSMLSIAASFPMMSERRVVVVKEFEKLVTNDSSKEVLAAYILRPLESTCLILIAPDADFRRKPYTDLKKHAEVVHCKPLYDNQIPSWILQRVRGQGKEIELDACQLLQAYGGSSLRALQSEIDKLFTFIADRKSISAEDVTQVVGATRGYTVFDLQNAVGRLDIKEATRILGRMLELGESPQLIIVMLTRFFNQLWRLSDFKEKRISEAVIATELKVHPFYAKQYIGFMDRFSTEHIENSFQALLAADTELKTTGRDPRIVMDLLIYSLIRNSREALRIPA